MKRYKHIFTVIEIILFLCVLVVIIGYVLGYKFDSTKKEFVLTGVTQIENLEKDTTVYFNDQKYTNESNIKAVYLDEKQYNFKIEKKNRQIYQTKVDVKKGEVTTISPILIPEFVKSNILKENINLLKVTDRSLFYTYKQNNLNFIERLTINKSLLSIDSTEKKLELPTTIDLTKKETLIFNASTNENLAFISDGKTSLIIDVNQSLIQDISSSLPSEQIIKTLFQNNRLFIQYEQSLYSLNIEDVTKFQRNLIFTGQKVIFNIDEDNRVLISYVKENILNLEIYNFNGNLLSKKQYPNQNLLLDSKSQIFFFNKKIYLLSNNVLYILEENKITIKDDKVKTTKFLDRNTLLIIKNNEIEIILKEKEYKYPISVDVKQIQFINDYFSFFYVDSNNALHYGDVGGQDKIILPSVNPSFYLAQNGSDIYIYFESFGSIKNIKFGNDI